MLITPTQCQPHILDDVVHKGLEPVCTPSVPASSLTERTCIDIGGVGPSGNQLIVNLLTVNLLAVNLLTVNRKPVDRKPVNACRHWDTNWKVISTERPRVLLLGFAVRP